MGYAIIIYLPPFCFVWMALYLLKSFVLIRSGIKLLKINRDEITTINGSLKTLILSVWGIDIGAVLASLLIIYQISIRVPFFSGVHSEWGIAFENAYYQAGVYIVCWVALYALMLLVSYVRFKKVLADKPKRNVLFIAYVAVSVALRAAFLCYAY